LGLDTPPSIELLEDGKAPRNELRARFEPALRQTLHVQTEWVMEIGVGPAHRAKAPVQAVTFEIETEARGPDSTGTTRFVLRVAKVTVKPIEGARPHEVEEAEALRGLTGTFSVTASGIVRELDIPSPPNATGVTYDMIDHIARSLRLASLPLPEQPVGAGAKWRVTEVIEERGVRTKQSSTYELLSVDGTRLDAKMTSGQNTPKQRFSPPGDPNDRVYELLDAQFEGEGSGTWQLGQLAPRSASERTDSILRMTTVEPKSEVVTLGTDATLTVREGR
jgi:hypothetical protein